MQVPKNGLAHPVSGFTWIPHAVEIFMGPNRNFKISAVFVTSGVNVTVGIHSGAHLPASGMPALVNSPAIQGSHYVDRRQGMRMTI